MSRYWWQRIVIVFVSTLPHLSKWCHNKLLCVFVHNTVCEDSIYCTIYTHTHIYIKCTLYCTIVALVSQPLVLTFAGNTRNTSWMQFLNFWLQSGSYSTPTYTCLWFPSTSHHPWDPCPYPFKTADAWRPNREHHHGLSGANTAKYGLQ